MLSVDSAADNAPDEMLSPAIPPSPLAAGRPRAPTPSTAISPIHDAEWSPENDSFSPVACQPGLNTPSDTVVSLNSPLSSFHPRQSQRHSPLLRSASEGEQSIASSSRSARPSQSLHLPDPSHFPDPYPFRHPHQLTSTPPGLSSTESSSTSARSSAYASSSGAFISGEYNHVHVAAGDDDVPAGTGIISDDVLRMLTSDSSSSSSGVVSRAQTQTDTARWSESYSGSIRSRSSSVNNGHEHPSPRISQKPSYDISWQTVDERDEVGISESETDDVYGEDDDVSYTEEKEDERTSAAVVAEEGRGMIVQGDGLPISQLHVQPGTTHLLIGSSSTPNAMPSFLASALPQISASLLALDISANFLGALPPILAVCTSLEELNIASNPLRVLPVFLADLINLRVLIADSTGITSLPDTLADLDKLHTLSIRRNKLHALPSWLCLLPALQALLVDGNPFQGPWKALVEPLLAKTPMTPMYPPSTPMFPLPSSSLASSEAELTDLEESPPPSSGPRNHFVTSPEEEDHTITPERAPFLSRTDSSTASPQARPLTRTRTTPSRSFYMQSRTNSTASQSPNVPQFSIDTTTDGGHFGNHEMRKMKSAGDLRKAKVTALSETPVTVSPARPAFTASLSSSNLLNTNPPSPERPEAKRFASLGPASSFGSPVRNGVHARGALRQSLWDNAQEKEDRIPVTPGSAPISSRPAEDDIGDDRATVKPRQTKESKEKGKRWGFLKKMSMGKMKPDSPPRPSGNSVPIPRHTGNPALRPSGTERYSKSPQIDMRFSTTGNLDVSRIASAPDIEVVSEATGIESSEVCDAIGKDSPAGPSSSSLLAPPSTQPRSAKRRSFLPIDSPFSLNIPEASAFVPGVTATNGSDDLQEIRLPSPVPSEEVIRREEERAREGYMRALRSVMAYLKDMNDLGLSQQASAMALHGNGLEEPLATRSRRPTMIEGSREVSMVGSDSPGLRSSESMSGIRSMNSSQTMSVATTDSDGSGGEGRKFKNDKGKRAMVVKEIILTERTYVKGMQELVEIYIKPSTAQVTILSSSSKDTVVPAAERKIVFGGIDALFSFHKDSFLPALEMAAAPLMNTKGDDVDPDGQLSSNVARAVGNIFLKHAAFMKMYSSYINNFDNAVQHVKYWTSDRNPSSPSPGASMSPSSSTAQLAGIGLSMSAVTGNVISDAISAGAGIPNLSTSQRKRIRSYLKRCRMNPRHSQLNLEGYLLLPVQRIPRYRLLLEELLRSTPPMFDYMDDPLDRALAEISSLANNMNEGKREAESRRKLVQWQSRIRGKFPSPLVQPHRRLIMDGPLLLTRVVRKAVVSFEAINGQGDATTVQVDCLAPELTPRPLMGILCNDLLVLCRDPSEGKDPTSFVDLWAVLRMQTVPDPASIVHGNALRLVDNKAILYFDAPSPSDALNWYRAINLHIPASKT